MRDVNYARVRALFHALCELPPDQRAARLAEAQDVDDDVRREVERLLAEHDRSAGPTIAPDFESFRRASMPDIPGFRIVRLLGEGGMGAVYEAEQERPHRRVALKIIRPGLITESIIRRFRREGEVLGRLSHPGIAQVYEVGVGDAAGRALPYLVMELVEGEPLTSRAASMSREQKLAVACEICDAVEHAHRRGVIHRDLKPGNILVDAAGRPKILDFGVSRVVDADLRMTTMRTEAGQILGTAAYMSPEQASADPAAVDHRSDVYSLGVVIFELLTGRLPHEISRLSLPDAIRVIREEEPTRIGAVDTSLRGDIDTILAKALERDRDRRYASAAALGDDIRRHLRNEPITAHRPSAIYQMRKFARRNRALVAGTAAVMAALLIGLIATGVALRREAAARGRAEESLAQAKASSSFLEHVLLGLNPEETEGKDTALLEDMLERAASSLDEEIPIPAVRAQMLSIIGRTYHSIYAHAESTPLLEQAVELLRTLGPERQHDLVEAQLVLADNYRELGRIDDADRTFAEVVATLDRSDDPLQRVAAYREWAELQMDRGDWSQALGTIERALALEDVATTIELGRAEMMHGAILRRLNRLDDAGEAYSKSLAYYRTIDAPVQEAIVLNSLAVLASNQGRLEDAARLYRESLDMRLAADPRPNPDTAATLSNLGRLLGDMGRLDEAAEMLEQSIAMHAASFPEGSYTLGFPTSSLASVESKRGNDDRAIELARQALGHFRAFLPEKHPYTATSLAALGKVLTHAGRYDEAEAAYREAVDMADALNLNPAVYRAPLRRSLADCLADAGKTGEAIEALREALSLLGEDDPKAADIRAKIDALAGGGPAPAVDD